MCNIHANMQQYCMAPLTTFQRNRHRANASTVSVAIMRILVRLAAYNKYEHQLYLVSIEHLSNLRIFGMSSG
jgi:hypothetical protein